MDKQNILIGALLSLLTIGTTAILGYRAMRQKAEEHDLQELKVSTEGLKLSTDYRIAGMQRELDVQAHEMASLRAEVAQCVRERLQWQEEKNRLLMQLLEARLRRGSGSGGVAPPDQDV